MKCIYSSYTSLYWPWTSGSGSMFPFCCSSRRFVDLLDSCALGYDKIKIFAFSMHRCTSAMTKGFFTARLGLLVMSLMTRGGCKADSCTDL